MTDNCKCKIIAFSNEKGGVGKTTSTIATAATLSDMGYRVLVVDLDPQGNIGFFSRLSEDSHTIFDVMKGDVELTEAIYHTDYFDVCPSNGRLASADKTFDGVDRAYILREAIEPAREMYDYILMDTSPTIGLMVFSAFTAADYVVIPAEPDKAAVKGVKDTMRTVATIKQYSNQKIQVAGVLVTKHKPNIATYVSLYNKIRQLCEYFNIYFFPVVIRDSSITKNASDRGISLLKADKHNTVTMAYAEFTKILIERTSGQP